jgi:intermediate cleaving peptidase 55
MFCTEDAHESLNSLHNKSVDLLSKALSRIGFALGVGDRLIDKLYPHYLTHPIGIGKRSAFCVAANFRSLF